MLIPFPECQETRSMYTLEWASPRWDYLFTYSIGSPSRAKTDWSLPASPIHSPKPGIYKAWNQCLLSNQSEFLQLYEQVIGHTHINPKGLRFSHEMSSQPYKVLKSWNQKGSSRKNLNTPSHIPGSWRWMWIISPGKPERRQRVDRSHGTTLHNQAPSIFSTKDCLWEQREYLF